MKNIRKKTTKAAKPRELAAPPSTPGRLLKIPSPAMRPPDIPELARLGGLPANLVPYRVRAFRNSLYVSASGNSTGTVNHGVALGFSRRIEDARQVLLQYGQNLSASEVKSLVEDMDWVEDQWIQVNVIDPEEIDPEKLGAELWDNLVARIPVLQEWASLPENVKRGQIVETLYRQMEEVARLVIKGGKTFDQARELTPLFAALWERYDALENSAKAHFSDVERWGPRSDDPVLPSRDDILGTIGSSFFGLSGPHGVERSMKAFRRWRDTRNKLPLK